MKARHVKMARSAYRSMKNRMAHVAKARANRVPIDDPQKWVETYVAGLAAGMLEFKHALGWIAEARP